MDGVSYPLLSSAFYRADILEKFPLSLMNKAVLRFYTKNVKIMVAYL